MTSDLKPNNVTSAQSNTPLTVQLGARSYPIFIGQGLLRDVSILTPYIKGKQVFVISNEVVAPLYLETVLKNLQGFQVKSIVLPDGEQTKTLDTAMTLYTRLLEARVNRSATLIALGGGVIGDITGFVAATYQRGIPFIQIPTTLLAQVDSSVGGKTGVNHPLGKNMIGAFYQPQCVIADTDTLNTLDDRQLSSGLAEVIKYGLIRDIKFAHWLRQEIPNLLARDPLALAYAIRRSCENKAEVVAADETEQGQRALLNLGHTFGHAIETALNYSHWLHGEAVAAGLYMAARLSQDLGWIGPADLRFVEEQLAAANLPTRPPESISLDQFMQLMALDKKVLNSKLRLVLLRAIGTACVTEDFDEHKLLAMLKSIERSPTQRTKSQ